MKKRISVFLPILLLFGAAVDAAEPAVTVKPAFPPLSFRQPTTLVPAPEGNRWYLAEKGGRLLTFAEGDRKAVTAADLRDRVDAGPSEAGLLGIAFSPDFAADRQIYLSYTAPGRPLISRISRFTIPPGSPAADPASEEILLTLPQPYGNHNGGQIAFGPDGYLYIGFGDGGSARDPQGNGQKVDTLLGKILRIDVRGKGGYAIPPDNPFAQKGGRPEIFAWGLRNPWRFTFDRESGRLWAGDVGQDAWEEVDLIDKGGNYGWDIREGAHCIEPPENCRSEGLIDPVAEYPNAGGDCSITGGYVYRGSAIPSLRGWYLLGDFCSGKIWGLAPGADGLPAGPPRLLFDSEAQISSFAEGMDGEIYLLDFGGGGIYRLVGGGR